MCPVKLKKARAGEFEGLVREDATGFIAAIEYGKRRGIQEKNRRRKIAEQLAINRALWPQGSQTGGILRIGFLGDDCLRIA